MKSPKAPRKPTDEQAFAFDMPAVVSNFVVGHRTAMGLRITFCEKHSQEGGPKLRAAVMLAPADALMLRDILTSLLGANLVPAIGTRG